MGKMSAGLLGVALFAFLLSFFHSWFYWVAWTSLAGGALIGVMLWVKHRRSSHPTLSHLAPDPDEGKPIRPH